MEKKLYKIEEGKIICGVCGGFAEYLNMDPALLRIITAALVLFAGSGLLLYIIAAIVMPVKPNN